MVEPISVTEEEFIYLEECVMSDPRSIVDSPHKYLLDRALDSRRGSYLYPLSEAEAGEVERLLLLRRGRKRRR